ncbi:MAG TPA: pyridoxamine 5'-phosphate oxidase family protein [Xanthobacteraceae bacterium]|nr:pyridoxamine 5'-phosphate oxidase family protein [Xanthobacteraceae bacterium]
MSRAFTRLAFSPAVKAAQARYGARAYGEHLEQREPSRDRLNDDLAAFIATTDSFFISSANSDGWPHVQHRGGPAGFLKVLDERTLAFADYSGNKHYITIGNLTENDRVMLFLIDYERGRRLKIWGRATIVDDDPVLLQRVSDPDYPAKVERVVRIVVEAWDLNCRQHFPKLVRAH